MPTFPNGLKDIIADGMQIEVPTGSKRHRVLEGSSQQPESQSSDGSTSSSSLSSPTMSPQSSWDSTLPSLHLDPKSSYFPAPASMPTYYPPRRQLSSPGSSYPSTPTSEPHSRASPSDSGSYFHPSNPSSPNFGRSERHQQLPQLQQEPRQSVPPRGSFTKELIARSAAAIPPPPPLTQSRTCGGPISSFMLNSTNTVVYSATALRNKAAGFSVGLVSLSPLDTATCCGGRCSGDCTGNNFGSGRSRNGVSSNSR
ncbi:hypothetical protein FRB98_006376 [Tulasnella sp. 332]|nr:hypothetical protein FRB98_006376 [Tulasnella sp. 332]